jgi:hypothetical protein
MADTDGSNGGSGGSGSGGSGSSSSGSGGGGSTSGAAGGTSTAGSPSIDDLQNALKQLEDNGEPDIKLSADTRDKYIKLFQDFSDALTDQLHAAQSVPELGYPGLLNSAIQTKNNLELDNTGLSGFQHSMNDYISYLGTFIDTVNKAADRLLQSG